MREKTIYEKIAEKYNTTGNATTKRSIPQNCKNKADS